MPQTLRVMAYNILYGGVTEGRDRTAQLAAQVNAVRPDALRSASAGASLTTAARA